MLRDEDVLNFALTIVHSSYASNRAILPRVKRYYNGEVSKLQCMKAFFYVVGWLATSKCQLQRAGVAAQLADSFLTVQKGPDRS